MVRLAFNKSLNNFLLRQRAPSTNEDRGGAASPRSSTTVGASYEEEEDVGTDTTTDMWGGDEEFLERVVLDAEGTLESRAAREAEATRQREARAEQRRAADAAAGRQRDYETAATEEVRVAQVCVIYLVDDSRLVALGG